MSHEELLHGTFAEGGRVCHMRISYTAFLSRGEEYVTRNLLARLFRRGEQGMSHENLLHGTFVERGSVCHMGTYHTALLSMGA